jgi:hypothetical protein
MSKSKPPFAKPPIAAPAAHDDEAAALELADLALTVARGQAGADELARAVRRHLLDRHDDLLYDAIDQARGMADGCFALLRDTIEEASGSVLLRRPGAPDMEVNAFAIPVFVHSTGGLRAEHTFQDQEAFDALCASVTAAGLESPRAKVVLVQHWYDLAEIDRVTFSGLHALVREAGAALNDRKLRPVPLLEQSMSGWGAHAFAAGDRAVELRFLLGFALKRADDPFYAVPRAAAQADAWYEARMERYRAWTVDAAPLVQRLLAPAQAAPAVHFLYQDLFFGARAQALAELFVLELLAEVNAHPGIARARLALTEVEGGALLRMDLCDSAGTVLAQADKELDPDADLATELADLEDALRGAGIGTIERA